jgi:chlorite dismutase
MTTTDSSQDSWISYVAYKLRPEYRILPEANRFQLAAFLVEILESPNDRVDVDTFSSVGFRADCDFFIRYVGPSAEELQEICAKVNNSGLGRHLDIAFNWVAHLEPGQRPKVEDERIGAPFFAVSTMAMQPVWFALGDDERKQMVEGYKALVSEHSKVEVNVARSFGMGDQDWVFGCEIPDLAEYEAMVRKLREGAFNEYVLEDGPTLLGRCLTAHEALELCGAL